MDDFDPYSLLCDQYKVLGHEGLGFTEIRIPKKGIHKIVNGMEEYVKTVMGYCKGDVYVGINPRKSNVGSGEAGTGMEQDVSHISCIVFDFDPIRPKDVPSTDEQHNEAIKIAGEFCREWDGMLVSSGSGAHVYIPIEPIPVVDVKGCADSLRNFGKQVQEKYSTATIKVDSIFDLPRIIRCWGSHNDKSDRNCYFLSGQYHRRSFVLSDYATKSVLQPSVSGIDPANEDRKDVDAARLESRFAAALTTCSKLRRIWEGQERYASRSENDMGFISTLLRVGFSVEETIILAPKNPHGKAAGRKDHDLEREVNRIYDKIKDTIPKPELELTAEEYLKDLDNRKPGIMTGFKRWDSMTAGLKPGRFYVDAGRPTEGKTTRLVQVAVNVARLGHKVLYFPTECARTAIVDKMLSSAAKVNLKKFQFGDFDADEKGRINAVVKDVLKLPIVIAENFSLRLADIERLVIKESPEYVIVDFLNGMSYHDANSPSELAAVVMGVKLIGKNRNIPLTLAAQLHRMDPKVEPSLSALKGTGKLEEEGDVITFVRTTDTRPYPALAEATILKNKYGEPGKIPMKFARATCEFEEVNIENVTVQDHQMVEQPPRGSAGNR